MTHTPPRASGVYQIRCIPTGKIYVGSAVELWKRWEQHRRSLRKGQHGNRYLQAAWKKYGEENFTFEVLELVDVAYLLQAEQEWINSTSCVDKDIGFNIRETAESSGSFKSQTWEGFIDPQGNTVIIIGLEEFCSRHNLDYRSMHRLAIGKSKLKSYKGWTHRNSVRQRDYVKSYDGFVNPEGDLVGTITNLAEFCRQHGLDKTHMVAVANGRILSHRGWTHINSRKRQLKAHNGFVDPNGQHVTITNLAEFCRQYGLHPVHMHQLKSGRRKSHKGWTWREDDEHDK